MNCHKVVWIFTWMWLGWIPLQAAVEQPLTSAQVNELIQTLTRNPRSTWLPAGTIKAQCLKYQYGEPGVAESTEEFRFDGRRFYWHIRMKDNESPDDSAAAIPSLPSRHSEFEMNRQRLFCWNGQRYTRYYQAAGYAIVAENQLQSPLELYGPFSAGIIPWGHGDYSSAVLGSYQKSAVKVTEEDREIIRLTMLNENIQPTLHMIFDLDPQKDYAALSYTMQNQVASIEQTYSDFSLVEGRWVPGKIVIERYDKRTQPSVLISYEDWAFDVIDPAPLTNPSFEVTPADGTLVELSMGSEQKSLLYHHSDRVDIKGLLEQKTLFAADGAGTYQNCATAAAWHIARKFSRPVASQELEYLVDQNTGQTSIYNLRQKIEGTGLYCVSVTGGLDALRQFDSCTALVHLSDSNHYVVLDRIDDQYVWLIDLTNRKFYWKKNIRDFLSSWKDRTVLMVSDDPRNLPMSLKTLSTSEEMETMGGDLGSFSCSEVIQITERVLCNKPFGGFLCTGVYYKFWERYGCYQDNSGNTCYGQGMPGYEYSPCINHPEILGACSITGQWLSRDIRACM